MNELATVAANDSGKSLAGMVFRASTNLANATSAAEVLDARDEAAIGYDVAKRASRIAKAKGAHDAVVTNILNRQADLAEIEAMAKRRLADEYDAAQARGEVQTVGGNRTSIVSDGNNAPTVTDIGLSRKAIHEARQIRDAESAHPGIVRAALDARIAEGQEPNKASIRGAIANLETGFLPNAPLKPSNDNCTQSPAAYRTSFTGNNEWYTPKYYVDAARRVMGSIDTDPASNEVAQSWVKAGKYHTIDDSGLDAEWHGNVWMNPPYSQPEIMHFIEKAVSEYQSGRASSIIILTHNSTDTRWFQKLFANSSAVCFTAGRVKFESPTGDKAAPAMGQAFNYFGPDVHAFKREFSDIGKVMVAA